MVSELFAGMGVLLGYFLVCIACLVLIRYFLKVPTELFRKTLHTILLFSVLILVYYFKTWWISVIATVIFAIVVFTILSIGELFKGYSKFLTERSTGELKRSLLLAFGMFAIIILVCWGLFKDKMLVLVSIYAWGFGDAAAALVGKRFGKHFVTGKLIEGRKSMEGTIAMFVVSFLSVMIVLLIRGGLPWHGYIPIAAITAAVCTVVELFTLKGYDTITCPLAAAATILPLLWVWGGLVLV
ncbi:MAG TPA: phosphatidate cytidylyltransferase [Clostridiaceae bacterium]|jgi:phytol kinase|nr:phosphatidate cytidylyltransferase [Clostridiaceae bacterium]